MEVGRRSLTRAWLALVAVLAGLCPAAAMDRKSIEDDWQRQDASRMREIREAGVVRFPTGELNWPGVGEANARGGLNVPTVAAPRLDGRLDDACWPKAATLPPGPPDQPVQPRIQIGCDGRHFYVGATFPTTCEPCFFAATTATDASGAVDGVKNGRYGFHTGLEPNPWWQVDLGKPQPLAKVVIYNRLDYAPGLHNADNLVLLVSDDGKSWRQVYENGGKPFGGIKDGKPLIVDLAGKVTARFVRIQLPSPQPIFFHLDEVEVYAEGDPEKNIALHRPAHQSRRSPWSRGGALCTVGNVEVGLASGNDSVRVMVGGKIASEQAAAIGREGARTTVEVALPLDAMPGGFPAAVAPFHSQPVALAGARREMEVVWPDNLALGYGRNRLTLGLRTAGPLDPPLELKIETAVFTPQRAERKVVFENRLTEAGPVEVEFRIAREGAAAVIVSGRQGASTFRNGRAFYVHPVAETLDRAERLAEHYGIDLPEEYVTLRNQAAELAAREMTEGSQPAAREKLYREARWLARRVAFENPLLNFEELLLLKRFTQETYPDVCLNHMPWCSRPGGDLCIVSMPGAEGEHRVRKLIDGRLGPGHVHGMDLSWDGRRVVFGYARSKSAEPPEGWRDRRTNFDLRRTVEPTHIFEIGIDGSGLRRLADGQWSDIDPTYTPGGDIVFVSERCGCSLQCNEYDKDETSCNLYVMRPDGTGIRHMSVSKDGDYLPHALADGTVAYTRWEYQERGWAHIQSIWTIRPDGTFADALYKQHMNNPWALEDMRSIPGSNKLAAIATGHHTLAAGPVVIVDPRQRMNDPAGLRIVTPGVLPPEGGMAGTAVEPGGVVGKGGHYMTPWPLSENTLLAAYAYGPQNDVTGYGIYLIDVFGTRELVYRDPAISCTIPIPLRPRQRPPEVASTLDPETPLAVCAVSNIAHGVPGIDPKQVRYLRIAHRLQWPYCNTYGGQRYEPDVKGVMINWTPARVIGEVPVEADGSAHFAVPADLPVYFQLLDENHMELRRMRSFISFQPGERRACLGCHETREEAPPMVPGPYPLALARDPSIPQPPPWGTRPISFLRDIQPVFGRHCTECHGGLKPAAGLDFSGGLTAKYNRCYDTILAAGLVSRSNVGDDAKITPPLAFGSHQSKLVHALRDGPCGKRAKLSEEDWLRLVTWIDANAPYHDGFINKRRPEPPYDLPADRKLAEQLTAIHARRCAGCHDAAGVTRLDWIDLEDPASSRFLAAPLAREAGGNGTCNGPVYRGESDPDYRAALGLVKSAVEKARRYPRRDLGAFAREDDLDGWYLVEKR